jgi:transposase-like protein
MRYQDKTALAGQADALTAPAHCPACRSSDVSTVSKVVTAASYWRCGACGEVWNVERLHAASRYTGSNRRY